MNFIGIDVHTNRFTCCYRNEQSSVDNPKDKRIETFELNAVGLARFFKTLTDDTYVLIEAAITGFSCALNWVKNIMKGQIKSEAQKG